jgi:hypothetical protein
MSNEHSIRPSFPCGSWQCPLFAHWAPPRLDAVSIKWCKDFQFSNFCDSISEVGCYIVAYSGIEHCLLTQKIGDLFSIVLGQGPDSVVFPQLFPFLRGSLFTRPIFFQLEAGISMCLQKGGSIMLIVMQRKEPFSSWPVS